MKEKGVQDPRDWLIFKSASPLIMFPFQISLNHSIHIIQIRELESSRTSMLISMYVSTSGTYLILDMYCMVCNCLYLKMSHIWLWEIISQEDIGIERINWGISLLILMLTQFLKQLWIRKQGMMHFKYQLRKWILIFFLGGVCFLFLWQSLLSICLLYTWS